MKRLPAALALWFLAACLAPARPVAAFSAQELFDHANLVVVARATANRDTTEKPVLDGYTGPSDGFVGVETDLEISGVLKGDPSLRKIVFHHYRFPDPGTRPPDGPHFVRMEIDAQGAVWYLLFLQREKDGRYAPVMDQIDPDGRDVLKLNPTLFVSPAPELPARLTPP